MAQQNSTWTTALTRPGQSISTGDARALYLKLFSGEMFKGFQHNAIARDLVMKRTLTNGKIIPTWADVLNRANLGFEVMHERNAHNFPLDLACAESTTVALSAPAIG